MATIRKRGEYQWEAQIRKAGFPPISKTFDTKPEAVAWANEKEAEMVRGAYVDRRPLEKTTFADLIERYGREITAEKKGASQEKSKLKILKASKMAKLALAHIEPADIADYRDERLTHVSAGTVIKEINLISNIFNVAASEWRLRGLHNPAEGVRRPKAPRGRDRRLDENGEEMQRLIDATHSPTLKVLLPLAIETAMRRGEMVSVRREDVNLRKRTIKLHDTKNGESREVPLSSRAVQAIMTLKPREDGELFGVSPNTVTQAFSRARKRARKLYEDECRESGEIPDPKLLKNLRLHDMRHEGTTKLFEKGLNPAEVSAITGHKDMRQLKRYTHLRAEDLAKKLD